MLPFQSQAACKAILDAHPTRQTVLPGKGSGFGFDKNPYCSYATKNGVHIVFTGEVSEWPGINAVTAAHDGTQILFLLITIKTFSSNQVASCL